MSDGGRLSNAMDCKIEIRIFWHGLDLGNLRNVLVRLSSSYRALKRTVRPERPEPGPEP